MSYFLILPRHKRDQIFTTQEYGIWLSDIDQIEKFLKNFCKRNKIKIIGKIDTSKAYEDYDFCRDRLKTKRSLNNGRK